jgi:hypothetical protein
MRKSSLFLSTILIGIISFFIIVNAVKTEPKQKIPTSTWIKAVCNEKNYCLDVQITCSEDKIIDIKPTGEGTYFPESWIDPRPIEVIKKWC